MVICFNESDVLNFKHMSYVGYNYSEGYNYSPGLIFLILDNTP